MRESEVSSAENGRYKVVRSSVAPLILLEPVRMVSDRVVRICVEADLGVRELTVWGVEPRVLG